MKKIAMFYKVSYNQFEKDVLNCMEADNETIKEMYDAIKIPKRATSGSAGYDFYLPCGIELEAGETIMIPTGIRCRMDDGWVLKVYPRSGLGFKFRLQLDNTVGIIDSDYFYSDNEGHIMVKITNDSRANKTISLEAGKAFIQGIFNEYGITLDDDANEIRNGGFGSTDKQADEHTFCYDSSDDAVVVNATLYDARVTGNRNKRIYDF